MARKTVAPKMGALTPVQTSVNRKAAGRRKAFESANPGRMQEVQTLGSESKKDAYARLGYHAHDTAQNHRDQAELPGMENLASARASGLMNPKGHPLHQSRTLPDHAPAPAAWEHMHPNDRAATMRSAAAYGVTPASAQRAFGAHLDQAHATAASHGATPYAGHFYAGDDPSRPDGTTSARQPREVLKASAAKNGVPFASQVVANGITSPRQKFSSTSRATGATTYPNDEMANHAIGAVNRGVEPERHQVSGIHGNTVRAAHAVRQQMEGRTTAELRNPGGAKGPGDSPFKDKTGPYTNAWLDPHGSGAGNVRFVSDVHSGGGGMAPHLDSTAPYHRDAEGNVKKNAQGNPTKDPSERERYLAIPGIHAMHDHAARMAMQERGLHSVSGAQGAQWGQEQQDRGLVKEHQAYPASSNLSSGQFRGRDRVEVKGQQGLF